jgi:hypothetical protein
MGMALAVVVVAIAVRTVSPNAQRCVAIRTLESKRIVKCGQMMYARYLPSKAGTKHLLTTPAWWVGRGAAALAATTIIVPSTATYARGIKPDEGAYRTVIGGPLDVLVLPRAHRYMYTCIYTT